MECGWPLSILEAPLFSVDRPGVSPPPELALLIRSLTATSLPRLVNSRTTLLSYFPHLQSSNLLMLAVPPLAVRSHQCTNQIWQFTEMTTSLPS